MQKEEKRKLFSKARSRPIESKSKKRPRLKKNKLESKANEVFVKQYNKWVNRKKYLLPKKLKDLNKPKDCVSKIVSKDFFKTDNEKVAKFFLQNREDLDVFFKYFSVTAYGHFDYVVHLNYLRGVILQREDIKRKTWRAAVANAYFKFFDSLCEPRNLRSKKLFETTWNEPPDKRGK